MLNRRTTVDTWLELLLALVLVLAISACGYWPDPPPLLKTFPVPADAQQVQRNNAKGITGRVEESLAFAVRLPPEDMAVPLAMERASQGQGWVACEDQRPTGWGKFIDRAKDGQEKEKLQFRRLYKNGDWLAELLIEQSISDKKPQGDPTVQLVHLRISNRDANTCN